MIGEGSIQSRGVLRYGEFPIKIYPFSHEFERLYGSTEEAMRYVSDVLSSNPSVLGNPTTGNRFLHGISFPWGYIEHDSPIRMVDLVGFEYDRPWDECNPESLPFIFKNGVIQPDSGLCETGFIIVGREGFLRRQMVEEGESLEDYLQQWANIGELGPLDPEIYYLKHELG